MITANKDFVDFDGTVYSLAQIAAAPKTKENAIIDAAARIANSWTYAKLTEKERATFCDAMLAARIIGTHRNRYEQYMTMYHFFLLGLGFDPVMNYATWREDPDPEATF